MAGLNGLSERDGGSMRDDAGMDRRDAVRTMLGVGALPLVGACAQADRARPPLTRRQLAGQRVVTALAGGKLGAAGFSAAVRRVTALRHGLR